MTTIIDVSNSMNVDYETVSYFLCVLTNQICSNTSAFQGGIHIRNATISNLLLPCNNHTNVSPGCRLHSWNFWTETRIGYWTGKGIPIEIRIKNSIKKPFKNFVLKTFIHFKQKMLTIFGPSGNGHTDVDDRIAQYYRWRSAKEWILKTRCVRHSVVVGCIALVNCLIRC